MSTETTDIKTISDADLNNLLNLSGPEIVPDNEDGDDNVSKTVFQRPGDSADNVTIIPPQKKVPNDSDAPAKTQEEIDAALQLEQQQLEDAEERKRNIASPVNLDALNDLVKDGTLLLFEAEEGKEEKKLEEYSKKELVELLKVNIQRVREEEAAKAPAEFFDSLPEKLQYAAKYVAEGGDNLEALFLSLAQAAQTESLDPATEGGQEQIVRRWLSATQFGTAEEIEEEVNSIKDRKELEKKAQQFKPKLDAKQQQIVEQQVRDAEVRRKQGEANAAKYRENVYKSLATADLNGLKLTPTQQGMIFNGLTNFDQRARNGYPTNELGLLLEKYNSVEPNPALISEAYWLLKDPKGYREAVIALGSKETTKTTVRQLKTAESQKATQTNLEQTRQGEARKTIKKPAGNIFSRT